jgi:hypothetical protein
VAQSPPPGWLLPHTSPQLSLSGTSMAQPLGSGIFKTMEPRVCLMVPQSATLSLGACQALGFHPAGEGGRAGDGRRQGEVATWR